MKIWNTCSIDTDGQPYTGSWMAEDNWVTVRAPNGSEVGTHISAQLLSPWHG
jgi:hypothetical protein